MGPNFNGRMRLLHGQGTQSGGRRTRFLHGPGTHIHRGLCRDSRRAGALCAVKTAISEIAKRLLRPHRIHTRAAGSILIERPRPRRVPGLRGGKSHRPGTSLMKPGALRPVMAVLGVPFLDAVRRTCLEGLLGRAPMSARPPAGPLEGPRREHKAANLFSH